MVPLLFFGTRFAPFLTSLLFSFPLIPASVSLPPSSHYFVISTLSPPLTSPPSSILIDHISVISIRSLLSASFLFPVKLSTQYSRQPKRSALPLVRPLDSMTRTSKRSIRAETDGQGRSDKTQPGTRIIGQKRLRSNYSLDEERLSPPPYQTRARSRVLQDRPSLPGKRNIFLADLRNGSSQENPSRHVRGLHDSGFSMDDADDEELTIQEHSGQGSNSSSRPQKKKQCDSRTERLNSQLPTKLSQISSPTRRKVNAPSRVHGYYQPAKESDLSSDSESLEEGDLSEEDSYSSTRSFSDTSSTFSSSSSSSDLDDDEQSRRSVSTSRSSTTKSGRPVRAVNSKASTIGAVATATTAKPSTKAAPSQATSLRAITKATKTTNTTKTTTASVTPALKNGVFGNPCRIPIIKKSVALAAAAYPPHHLVASKIVPRPTTTDTTTRSRSRPPRQVRLKTGRWTKAEDNALYQGVVEYLAQFGLEPKPFAHLPLHENVKEEEEKEVKDEDTAVHEHGCGDIDEKLHPSALERIMDESRRRVEYDAAVWKVSAAVCQLGERYRSSNNRIFASESDTVRDRENDTSLFDELVDVSRDNFQADSGQEGYLNLESRAGHGHHTPLLPPFHVSSPVEDAGIDTGTRFAAESGLLNAHSDLSLGGNIFVRTTSKPPPTIRPQETCIDAYNQNIQVSDDYHNYNNLPHQHHQQQQQRTPLQQQYSQHVRYINQVYSDQNHRKQQQYQWSPLPRYQQQNHQQQPHGPGGQQYGVPSIYPHWEEAPHETRAGDIWLAPINEVNSRALELSMAAHRGETSGSGAAFTTEGGYGRARSNTNRSATVATSSAAIETVLSGELFPDTTNTTTSSTSPPPTIITSTSTPTPSPPYKTQASYASAVSRRLTTCPWSHIATLAVPGRTGVQAQARWSEALDPRVKKGPWSEDEDALLLEGVERSDKCWIWIADSIEGRTQRQCRTRWVQLTINAERKAALVVLEGVTEF